MTAGHRPVDWFTRGVYPSCSCGFAPHNNTQLVNHWAEHGTQWIDDHGKLIEVQS